MQIAFRVADSGFGGRCPGDAGFKMPRTMLELCATKGRVPSEWLERPESDLGCTVGGERRDHSTTAR